jgi:predicted nucleic acid-binding Zn ribbon protein
VNLSNQHSALGIGHWSNKHPHVCACGTAFTGPKNAKYCGEKCRRAALDRQRRNWAAKQKRREERV